MGVTAKCFLPPATQIEDVAAVMGALLGLHVEKKPLGRDGYYADVRGVKAGGTELPAMAQIVANMNGVDNDAAAEIPEVHLRLGYHYAANERGEHLLMPASTPARIALMVGLVVFFGGHVQFNDAAEGGGSGLRVKAKPGKYLRHSENEQFRQMQDDILAIEPLTKADVDKYRKFAAYEK